jgi:hypothetical protein
VQRCGSSLKFSAIYRIWYPDRYFLPKIALRIPDFSSKQLDILDLYKIVQDPGFEIFGGPRSWFLDSWEAY